MTSNVDQVVLWMVSGLSEAALVNACVSRLNVAADDAPALVAEARKMITLAAEYNRDELLGTALTRLNDLYSRCMAATNDKLTSPTMALAKALSVQQEINRLTGLHAGKGSVPDHENAAESRDELSAVAAYLYPLALAAEGYPVREHARLAAQRIRELESATAGAQKEGEKS